MHPPILFRCPAKNSPFCLLKVLRSVSLRFAVPDLEKVKRSVIPPVVIGVATALYSYPRIIPWARSHLAVIRASGWAVRKLSQGLGFKGFCLVRVRVRGRLDRVRRQALRSFHAGFLKFKTRPNRKFQKYCESEYISFDFEELHDGVRQRQLTRESL